MTNRRFHESSWNQCSDISVFKCCTKKYIFGKLSTFIKPLPIDRYDSGEFSNNI